MKRRGLVRHAPLAMIVLMGLSACAHNDAGEMAGLDTGRLAFAMDEAASLRATGARVWCVPFARNLSGVEIYGNANTWWQQAKGLFNIGNQPEIGAVMAFSGSRKLPMGHVAVVSKVIEPDLVLVDHANWHRNEVSLGMAVRDVSEKNDWSRVRVESSPGTFGSVYMVDGFIHPPAAPVLEASARGALTPTHPR